MGKVINVAGRDPHEELEAAQRRVDDHLAALEAAGKSKEAAALEASLRSAESNNSISDQYDW